MTETEKETRKQIVEEILRMAPNMDAHRKMVRAACLSEEIPFTINSLNAMLAGIRYYAGIHDRDEIDANLFTGTLMVVVDDMEKEAAKAIPN